MEQGKITKPTVLLVDDDHSVAVLVKRVIESVDASLLIATNAEDGLRLAVDEKPDVILLDIRLPNMDGISALRQLRTDDATANIPVYMLTALAFLEDQQAALAAGATGFLSKPVPLTLLRQTLVKQLGRAAFTV